MPIGLAETILEDFEVDPPVPEGFTYQQNYLQEQCSIHLTDFKIMQNFPFQCSKWRQTAMGIKYGCKASDGLFTRW